MTMISWSCDETCNFTTLNPNLHTWLPLNMWCVANNLYICSRHSVLHLCQNSEQRCPMISQNGDQEDVCLISGRVLNEGINLESEEDQLYSQAIDSKKMMTNQKHTPKCIIRTTQLNTYDVEQTNESTDNQLFHIINQPMSMDNFHHVDIQFTWGLNYRTLYEVLSNQIRWEFYSCLHNLFNFQSPIHLSDQNILDAVDGAVAALMSRCLKKTKSTHFTRVENQSYRSTIGRRKIDNLKKHIIIHLQSVVYSDSISDMEKMNRRIIENFFEQRPGYKEPIYNHDPNSVASNWPKRRRKLHEIFNTPVCKKSKYDRSPIVHG